eukprot:CAMPEP_0181320066 /NCGR_PEP_ID=MMETSP1101-20121128/17916_1 /TAXON_ID=46948 /ORGANISM="Rhodomonas abbreviata, Strain Caron Lab Isolate" /LENGTH=99 /DNA_ID=CAMNT_0023427727 /DNA_START=52 /DNA_END=351 /DNA_ORIENTATION=+
MRMTAKQKREAKELLEQRSEIQNDIRKIFARVTKRKKLMKEGVLSQDNITGEWEAAGVAAAGLIKTIPKWPAWMPDHVRAEPWHDPDYFTSLGVRTLCM